MSSRRSSSRDGFVGAMRRRRASPPRTLGSSWRHSSKRRRKPHSIRRRRQPREPGACPPRRTGLNNRRGFRKLRQFHQRDDHSSRTSLMATWQMYTQSPRIRPGIGERISQLRTFPQRQTDNYPRSSAIFAAFSASHHHKVGNPSERGGSGSGWPNRSQYAIRSNGAYSSRSA